MRREGGEGGDEMWNGLLLPTGTHLHHSHDKYCTSRAHQFQLSDLFSH